MNFIRECKLHVLNHNFFRIFISLHFAVSFHVKLFSIYLYNFIDMHINDVWIRISSIFFLVNLVLLLQSINKQTAC